MTSARRLSTRIAELTEQRVPFVHATVVRAQCPTSARPGDGAVVLADGSIEGFIGGQCAESSVQLAAGDVLETGEALLLRILPEADDSSEAEGIDTEVPGARTVVNPCLSGGAIEVFLEPKLPASVVCVVGNTPIAESIALLGQQLGFAIDHTTAGPVQPHGALAVVVSSHGRGEEEAITAAVEAGVGFVGLVASHKRATAVIDSLDFSAEQQKLVRAPVGLTIGAKTAEEIALSILAEIVSEVRLNGLAPPVSRRVTRPDVSFDPVCGMTVSVTASTPHLHHGGEDYWYCNVGCRNRHIDDLQAGVNA